MYTDDRLNFAVVNMHEDVKVILLNQRINDYYFNFYGIPTNVNMDLRDIFLGNGFFFSYYELDRRRFPNIHDLVTVLRNMRPRPSPLPSYGSLNAENTLQELLPGRSLLVCTGTLYEFQKISIALLVYIHILKEKIRDRIDFLTRFDNDQILESDVCRDVDEEQLLLDNEIHYIMNLTEALLIVFVTVSYSTERFYRGISNREERLELFVESLRDFAPTVSTTMICPHSDPGIIAVCDSCLYQRLQIFMV